LALPAPLAIGADLSEAWPLDVDAAAQVTAGDINGDGVAEVVASGGGLPPRILWIDADGVRVESVDAWHVDGMSPVLGDVDGDVDVDLVTLEPGFGAVVWPSGMVP
jgi:hypothetical protein